MRLVKSTMNVYLASSRSRRSTHYREVGDESGWIRERAGFCRHCVVKSWPSYGDALNAMKKALKAQLASFGSPFSGRVGFLRYLAVHDVLTLSTVTSAAARDYLAEAVQQLEDGRLSEDHISSWMKLRPHPTWRFSGGRS